MITHASVVAWSSETFRGYGSPREDVSASDRESWSRLRSFEMFCTPLYRHRRRHVQNQQTPSCISAIADGMPSATKPAPYRRSPTACLPDRRRNLVCCPVVDELYSYGIYSYGAETSFVVPSSTSYVVMAYVVMAPKPRLLSRRR